MAPVRAHGALLLLFDIAADAAAEHDDWHSHEHMPERLAIPGFVRGTRWIAGADPFHYCVLYEVAEPCVLDSTAYRERLDHPTPWTAAMMRHYRGMRRTLCSLAASSGQGIGGTALVVTFAPAEGRQSALDRWLLDDIVPELAQRPGLASCRVYRRALAGAAMTSEQEIRGRDASVHSALLVTGYDEGLVAALARADLAPEQWVAHGAASSEFTSRVYRLAHALSATSLA
jgi:hypothetical protein